MEPPLSVLDKLETAYDIVADVFVFADRAQCRQKLP